MRKDGFQDQYETVCEVTCIDNGRSMEVDVINFRPEHSCKILVEKKIDVFLKYNAKHDLYVGSKAGMDFTTKGPSYIGSFRY